MSYVVSLKQYDGPLDLLLTLIGRAKVDIRDIFVSEITEQYLASMAGVDELDMDSASEFLQMAATLIEIKSRALLPKPPREDEAEESPEEALIRQLTEYKTFKELSGDMQQLEAAAREMLEKLPEEYPLPPPAVELTGLTLEGLMRAMQRVLSRIKDDAQEPARREIRKDVHTVQSCIYRIQSRLQKGAVTFDSLFEDAQDRTEVVTMFMALLELMKLGSVHASQGGVFGEILIARRAPGDSPAA